MLVITRGYCFSWLHVSYVVPINSGFSHYIIMVIFHSYFDITRGYPLNKGDATRNVLWVWIAGARNHRGQICCADAASPGNGAGQAPAPVNRCGFGPNKKRSKKRRAQPSLDWFKGKFTGNHGFYHSIWGFPVNVPLNQSIEPGWWFKKNDVSGDFSGFRLASLWACVIYGKFIQT